MGTVFTHVRIQTDANAAKGIAMRTVLNTKLLEIIANISELLLFREQQINEAQSVIADPFFL